MSPEALSLSTLGLGLVLGVRHALDADHLAAISTIVAEGRSWKRAAYVGVVWGLGHSAALLGAALILVAAGLRLPQSLVSSLEMLVGAVIVAMGGRLVWRAWTGKVHIHPHSHGELTHAHPHGHAAASRHHHPMPKAAFAVGVMHGLAGSAALMLIVLSTIRSTSMALAYVALFGVGATMGMAVMSSAMTVPMALFATQRRGMQIGVGALSVVFGVFYATSAFVGL